MRWRVLASAAWAICIPGAVVRASQGEAHTLRAQWGDTVTATQVRRDSAALYDLLRRVDSTLPSSLDSSRRQRLIKAAGALSMDGAPPREWPSHRTMVTFRGRRVPLTVAIRESSFFAVDVHLITPSPALRTTLRAVVREAYLASLSRIGRVQLGVYPGATGLDDLRTTFLHLQTHEDHGCGGKEIYSALKRTGDTLQWTLHGARGRAGPPVCSMHAPAETSRRLPLGAGRYVVQVHYRGDTSTFLLLVTDSSLALETERSTFVNADERIRWRAPRRSFLLKCHAYGTARETMCGDLNRWVASLPGVEPVEFGSNGISPFQPEQENYSLRPFRARDRATIEKVRACVQAAQALIAPAVGVSVQVQLATGERTMVSSRRAGHEPHAETPASITGSAACRRG